MSSLNNELTIGQRGSKIVADTDEHEGNWAALVVLNDAEIESITSDNIEDVADLDDVTLSAGTQVFGNITKVELKSGIVQMYNKGN